MKHWLLNKRKSSLRDSTSEVGTAAVEMALLSPLLVLMLLGTIDFARAIYDGMAVSNAARAGVQYGAQSTAKAKDYAGIVQAALEEAPGMEGLSVVPERYCMCPSGMLVDCDSGSCGSLEGASRVYVKVTVQKTFQTLFSYPGIPHTINLNQVAVMRAR